MASLVVSLTCTVGNFIEHILVVLKYGSCYAVVHYSLSKARILFFTPLIKSQSIIVISPAEPNIIV